MSKINLKKLASELNVSISTVSKSLRNSHEIETVKITTDDFGGGFTATEHLIENGCRNIAYLSISQKLSIDNKRMQGYLEALNKHNIKFDKTKIVKCNNDNKNNIRLIKKL